MIKRPACMNEEEIAYLIVAILFTASACAGMLLICFSLGITATIVAVIVLIIYLK